MARVREPEQPKPTGFVASATVLSDKKKKPHKKISSAQWQQDAWAWYDTIGEFRYAVSWVGNLFARVKLTVTRNGEPVTDGPAVEALELLFGGPDGQVEMLRQLGIHYTVAGEAYIVAEGKGQDIDDDWYVIAAVEMKETPEGWKAGKHEFQDPLVIRTWKPHPRKHSASDAPTRAVLPILSEIEGLTKHVAAQIDSRLAGAGMLILPSEIMFAGSSSTTANGETQVSPQVSADEFLRQLGETMMKPIEDRAAASAVVPFVLQAAGEHLDKIQHLTFWSELDNHAIELRNEAIRRLALGMDMPPEILTGIADLNHWGSWQVEEASIKSHTEPLIKIITGDLTEGYLRPFLLGSDMDEEEASEYEITADTTALRLRPNRSKEAIELFEHGELKASTMRTENGFTEADAPDDDERLEFFIRKVASGSTTPELVAAALARMGIQLQVEQPAQEPTEARPNPSITEHPSRDLPDTEDALAATIDRATIAAQAHIVRALERAGNRMKTRHGALPKGILAPDAYMHYEPVSLQEASALVADAWMHVDRVDCGLPADFLKEVLPPYTAGLLSDRQPLDPKALREYLRAHAKSQGVLT